MTQDINLGGTIYISSKRAAEITGYSQDYIGQLARAGQIEARRVAGLWYVLEESLLQHKHKADEFVPTPPIRVSAETEASVSFDGKDYISASRAAKITGYSQDYVGQLARGEKIPSRQIGSRWYVDRTALIEHKRHNDSLLGAVQADSVGIQRPVLQESAEMVSQGNVSDEQHFSYIEEPLPLLPEYEAKEEIRAINDNAMDLSTIDETPTMPENEFQIPIRVVEPVQILNEPLEIQRHPKRNIGMQRTRIALYSLAFFGVITVAGIAILQRSQIAGPGGNAVLANVNASAIDVVAPVVSASAKAAGGIARMSSNLLAKELVYQRQNH